MAVSAATASKDSTAPQTYPLASAGLKLSASKVFARMRPLLCCIHGAVGESSAFFINHKGTVVTVAHNIPHQITAAQAQFDTSNVQINYGHQDRPYFPTPTAGIVPQHAKALDLFSMETSPQVSESDLIPILPEDILPEEGMKVYFAGFPLGQDTPTFHRGTISSITHEKGIRRFTIDGTVVPGNSGGPVVIQHLGKVYLIGVITSEVADFSPEDQKTIAIMKALSDAKKQQPPPANPNAMTISTNGGLSTPIQITTPEGVETVQVNDRDTVCLALDLIQRNLSTGIGKAVDIRHYAALFQATPPLEEPTSFSFPVGKGKALITGSISDNSAEKRIAAKYIEVRYGNTGGGNRGIRITLCPPFGTGTVSYKFSPNPHNAPGNYNKNQTELYSNAAVKIVNELIRIKGAPQSVDFDACQTTYTAALE